MEELCSQNATAELGETGPLLELVLKRTCVVSDDLSNSPVNMLNALKLKKVCWLVLRQFEAS